MSTLVHVCSVDICFVIFTNPYLHSKELRFPFSCINNCSFTEADFVLMHCYPWHQSNLNTMSHKILRQNHAWLWYFTFLGQSRRGYTYDTLKISSHVPISIIMYPLWRPFQRQPLVQTAVTTLGPPGNLNGATALSALCMQLNVTVMWPHSYKNLMLQAANGVASCNLYIHSGEVYKRWSTSLVLIDIFPMKFVPTC